MKKKFQTSQAQFLQKHKAHNWKWPEKGNRWNTGSKAKGPSQSYSGPSKRTRARRLTRGKKAHTRGS